MIIKSIKVESNRNWINGQKLAHLVWNHYNPDNKWRSGFFVHHIDGDSLNDHISNLMLVTKAQHNTLHFLGKPLSNEHKEKVSKGNKGKGGKWLGKKHTLETRQKMSLAQIGEKHHMYGKCHSEEAKYKMSLSHKGKMHTEETKDKISKAKIGHIYNLGSHHSEETKLKIGLRNKGKIVSEETKNKISEAKKGIKVGPFSDEHKRKISEKKKLWWENKRM